MLIKLIEQNEKNPREGKTFPSGKHRYFASGCAVLSAKQKQWSEKPAGFQTKNSLVLILHSLFNRSALNPSDSAFSVSSWHVGHGLEPCGTESFLLLCYTSCFLPQVN